MALDLVFKDEVIAMLEALAITHSNVIDFVREEIESMQARGEEIDLEALNAKVGIYNRAFQTAIIASKRAFGYIETRSNVELEQNVWVKMPGHTGT